MLTAGVDGGFAEVLAVLVSLVAAAVAAAEAVWFVRDDGAGAEFTSIKRLRLLLGSEVLEEAG